MYVYWIYIRTLQFVPLIYLLHLFPCLSQCMHFAFITNTVSSAFCSWVPLVYTLLESFVNFKPNHCDELIINTTMTLLSLMIPWNVLSLQSCHLQR